MIRHYKHCRLIAILAAVGAASSACGDLGPSRESWEDAAVVSAQLRVTGFLKNDGVMTPIAQTVSGQLPIIRFPTLPSNGANSDRRAVHQWVDSTGATITVVNLYGPRGGPLKRVFAFRNGKIIFVASPKFKAYQGGWVRTRVRLTVFDAEGGPAAQTDHVTAPANHARAGLDKLRQLADATTHLILPATAHASEEEAACELEGALYKAAVFAATTAAIAVVVAAFHCKNGNPNACLGIPGLLTTATAAAYAAYAAYEKWAACLTEAQKVVPKPSDISVPELGSFSGGLIALLPPLAPSSGYDWAINSFIDSAIAAGYAWCSESGDHCIYGAADE